jgi:hypothetical protein
VNDDKEYALSLKGKVIFFIIARGFFILDSYKKYVRNGNPSKRIFKKSAL